MAGVSNGKRPRDFAPRPDLLMEIKTKW